MFCDKCGVNVEKGTRYCPNCGNKINIDSSECENETDLPKITYFKLGDIDEEVIETLKYKISENYIESMLALEEAKRIIKERKRNNIENKDNSRNFSLKNLEITVIVLLILVFLMNFIISKIH